MLRVALRQACQTCRCKLCAKPLQTHKAPGETGHVGSEAYSRQARKARGHIRIYEYTRPGYVGPGYVGPGYGMPAQRQPRRKKAAPLACLRYAAATQRLYSGAMGMRGCDNASVPLYACLICWDCNWQGHVARLATAPQWKVHGRSAVNVL